MEIFRSPDSSFKAVTDFPYPPHYIEFDGLRTHFIDEGPKDSPIALLIHGEPTWSYLYRKMIPPLVKAGFRCIAPDHIGFGKSDKVLQPDWYTAASHINRLAVFIEKLELSDITLFVQDWGGPIGLVNAVRNPERFSNLVILNTWLHHKEFEYSPGILAWREAATNRHWLGWTGYNLPCGAIVRKALATTPEDADLIETAYEAPFIGNQKSKAGALRFPWLIPYAQPKEGAAEEQQKTFEILKTWQKPVHFIFGANDPIFLPSWGRSWAQLIPRATFSEIEHAGHFLQEDAGGEIVTKCLNAFNSL